MRDVVAIVNASEASRPKEIAEKLSLDQRNTAMYLKRAVDAGLIDKAGRGLYVPVNSVNVLTSDNVTPLRSSHVDTYNTHPEEEER